jgi:hypothetical protein
MYRATSSCDTMHPAKKAKQQSSPVRMPAVLNASVSLSYRSASHGCARGHGCQTIGLYAVVQAGEEGG